MKITPARIINTHSLSPSNKYRRYSSTNNIPSNTYSDANK